MKTIKFGNILEEVKTGIIVHGCNAQGVMGSGIAKQVKEKWPECFITYRDQLRHAKEAGTNPLGLVFAWPTPDPNGPMIANAITQDGFGKDGKRYVSYSAIQAAFKTIAMAASATPHGIDVHYPLIGAGLGGGDWSIISDIISNTLDRAGVEHFLWILE